MDSTGTGVKEGERVRAKNWYTETADTCRLPELIPTICEKCVCNAYCHRQLTIFDQEEQHESTI